MERLETTAQRARDEKWPYEQFLETLCEAEVFAREASGARTRTRTAAFPAHKTLEDFDFTAQPSAERRLVMHPAQLAWIEEHANACLIGPPGTGKSSSRDRARDQSLPARLPRRVRDRPKWVSRLEEAQERNTLDQCEILGDAMVAAALIDRLVHRATMVTFMGKSYRLRERGTASAPRARPSAG